MTTMTATELARNLSRVLDRLERGGEEVVITRNERPVATIVPGAPHLTATEAFADLFGVLPPDEGEAWSRDLDGFDRPAGKEMRDPWAS